MKLLKEGKTNWKYVLIVVILAVIVGGGILWCYLRFQEIKFLPLQPENKVTITTDKTEYEQGETIKIVLRNNLNRLIFYKDFRNITCAGTSFSLGKKENEEYKNFYPLGTEKCIEPTVELEPDSEKIYSLNSSTLKKREWDEIYDTELSGIFKLQFNYFFEEIEHEKLEEAVYSNEFTIKEKIPKEATPEEVAGGFFHWYFTEGGPSRLVERADVTEEYKQKIAEIIKTSPMADPVIFAQDFPDKGFKIGEATIQDKNASLKVTLIWSGSDFGHVLKVDFVIEDNQWKIDNITHLEGDVTWKTYQNENYRYKINYPDFWSFVKDEPKSIVISNCPKREEICMEFNIDILSDTGGGNLNNIEEVKSLKVEGWDYEYTTVGGIKAIKLVRPCPTIMGACTAPELTRYYVIKGNYTYRIEFETGYAGCRIACDQILSTFRFLE